MSSIELCHSSSNHHKANSSNNHHQQKRSSSSFDLEGLEESLVDNNDDDEDDDDDNFMDTRLNDPSNYASESGIVFDHNLYLIREALIRDSASRTEDDIEIIVRFLSIINSNHDHMTRRRLAPHFVLAEIEARDTRVLTHGEKLDAYCIVAAGSLRHVLPCDDNLLIPETSVDDDTFMDHQSNQYPYSSNRQQCGAISDNHSSPSSSTTSLHHPHQYSHQNTRFLHVGDEFGAHLDDRVVYGEIFTNEDFVWVLCVPHVIFDQICGEKTFKTIRDEVTGNIIEMRANCMLPLSTTNQLEINSLGSTNLTSSDLSLSQFSENKSQTQLEISEDFVSEINIVPAKQNIQTSKQPNSLSSSSTPAKSTKLSSNGNNELIRATKERLYELLLSSEPNENFIEDFLLTFRIWSERDLHPSKDSKIMADLMNRICRSVRNGSYVENCVRIVLIWLVNHYQDFHTENRYLLDEFENALKENSVHKSQLRLFYMHLSAKSIERQVTMTRSDRNSPLLFSLIGGYECSARLFIGELSLSENLANSPKPNQLAQLDLRPGDRIISINGVDCHVMPIGRAYELCRSSTHLSLQVKYDPHLFYALIEGRHETKRQIVETFPLNSRISSSSSTSSGFGSSSTLSSNNQQIVTSSTKEHKKEKEAGGGNIWKQKVRSLVSTTNQLISSNILHNNSNSSSSNNSPNSSNPSIPNSLSNNSISVNSSSQNSSHPRILSYEIPEIIKIYSFEHNDCCFLPIHSSTTVRECIQLSLRQFKYSSNLSSRDFALYEYSVIMNGSSGPLDESSVANSTVVKRLSEGTSDLVNNIGLNSRLYLKLVNKTKDSSGEALTDSDIAKDIIKDLSVNSLLTLKGLAIARELTARDFRLFCKIESQQFVYDLAFNDPNNHSPSNENSIVFERTRELQEFERKTNEEMFWTINQVLGEKRSISKRVKAIKQLIRIATLAMKLNNYNTLFAIISGLMHLSVSRLKSCWDKVPSKHLKQLQKLQQLMDPSRNFYNFRQQLMQKLREDNGALIIIPFFPLVKKDLSFIWLANQTFINSSSEPPQSNQSGQSDSESHRTEMLVNWEKMRLLSEKIREIQKMANTTSLAMAAVSNLNTINSANLPESSSVANEPIDPNLLFRIFADNLTLDHKSSNDHKKLWENQRMIKRVQSFLDETFSSISSDEHELMTRSYSCELPQTPSSNHPTRSSIASTMSSNSQLSHPSPTPSSASSSSNSLSMNSDSTPGQLLYRPHRPKFGQTSPKQLRKLLALSDGSVIVPHSSSNDNIGSNGNHGSSYHHHNIPNNTSHSNHFHHYHHHHAHYHQHNNGSKNSIPLSPVNEYNQTHSSNPYNSGVYAGHQHSIANNFYVNGVQITSTSHILNNNQPNKTSYSMHMMPTNQHFSNVCCSMGGRSTVSCCTSSGNGLFFPSQPYCSCCNSIMRPSMMIMAPPQTSGLMPNCHCSSRNHTSRRHNSLPPKQSLPVESSSVTSLRRLDQYQQMTRYRDIRNSSSKQSNRRPQCPDYDTTMQRICGGNLITVNGINPASVLSKHRSVSNCGGGNGGDQPQHHHREDIV